MSIASKFENLSSNVIIDAATIAKVSERRGEMIKRLNKDFRDADSETANSFYAGSYWRDTDIHTSDIDLIYVMPYEVFEQYNSRTWNWQSALLQAVKTSIQKRYKTTDSHWDGQVVAVDFTDWINFEIVPCFLLKDNAGYYYPDTHNGWTWKTTNPKAEIKAIKDANDECNGNLKPLCRMVRQWKETCNVQIWGLLIDTFAHNFMRQWGHKDESCGYYDWMTRDFFKYLSEQNEDQEYWLAPWSNQRANRKWPFHYKASQAYSRALEAITYENAGYEYSANQKWKEIFGSKFTG